jgi:hypothetical protein
VKTVSWWTSGCPGLAPAPMNFIRSPLSMAGND